MTKDELKSVIDRWVSYYNECQDKRSKEAKKARNTILKLYRKYIIF